MGQASEWPPEGFSNWAARLYAIRSAGIIDLSWLANEIGEGTREVLERQRDREREAHASGFWSRIGSAIRRIFGFTRSIENEAGAFAKELKALFRDRKIVSREGFQTRLAALVHNKVRHQGLMEGLRRNWLDVLELPLDALEWPEFRKMLTAAFYRFAYGRNKSVNFFSQLMATDSEGAYLVYLRDTGSGLLERRILAFRADDSGPLRDNAIRAVELSRENSELIIRAGVVIPNQGHNAFALSGNVNLETCRSWLGHWAAKSDEPLFELDACAPVNADTVTQSHRLAFLTLRQRSHSEIVGAFLDGERHGQMTGRRLGDGELTARMVAEVGRLSAHDASHVLSASDQNLVAAMPRHPGGQAGAPGYFEQAEI